jgi:hypothetical protein
MTKLIWITPEAEQVIGYCARVSNPAKEDTQLEHREIADSIKALMDEHLPITMGVIK